MIDRHKGNIPLLFVESWFENIIYNKKLNNKKKTVPMFCKKKSHSKQEIIKKHTKKIVRKSKKISENISARNIIN